MLTSSRQRNPLAAGSLDGTGSRVQRFALPRDDAPAKAFEKNANAPSGIRAAASAEWLEQGPHRGPCSFLSSKETRLAAGLFETKSLDPGSSLRSVRDDAMAKASQKARTQKKTRLAAGFL
jgi:hypothetical protein